MSRTLTAGVIASAALVAAACADRAAPLLAPRAPRPLSACDPNVVIPCTPPCTDASCGCTSGSGDSSCTAPGLPVPAPLDSTKPGLRIASAAGPNPGRSFTSQRGERTLALAATVYPASLAGSVAWTVLDDPTDRVASAPPETPAPNGTPTSVNVPAQTTARWRLPHGTAWADKALAFKVVASVDDPSGLGSLRDSATVRQREADVLRQEYVDFRIPVPGAGDVKAAADVAGVTRFAWAQLNQGDYSLAVLTPRLLGNLNQLEYLAGRPLVLSSVFRNPAHQRYHISVSGGARVAQLSQHQYGTAVDLSTEHNRAVWGRLRDVAKRIGACAEPLNISTVDHVHADWRPGAPQCPKGW